MFRKLAAFTDTLTDSFSRNVTHKLMGHVAAAVDISVVRTAQALSGKRRQGSSSKSASELASAEVASRTAYLDGIAAQYNVGDDVMYRLPTLLSEADIKTTLVRSLDHHGHRGQSAQSSGAVVDLSYKSGFVPVVASHDSYLKYVSNRTCHVRHFRHTTQVRPAIVYVHGYRAGAFGLEEWAFQSEWFYRQGFDVAMYTLPFHALRADPGQKASPKFPTADVARTNEALAQITWDLRRLIAYLRGRGAPAVGVAGMSLGGYSVSSFGTVEHPKESRVDALLAYIPLSDLTTATVEHEAMRGVHLPKSLIASAHQAMACQRPLGRRPKITGEQVLVIGAEHDRITPMPHAEALARHFDAELFKFGGGHIAQLRRGPAFQRALTFFQHQLAGTRS